MLQALRDFLSLRPKPKPGFEINADSNQALYLTAENLTFPGVSVAAGLILNFVTANTDANRWWIALIVALIFGGFLTYLALSDPKADTTQRGRGTSAFVGLVNTALLWITVYGVSSI